jgi:hypothetical protein
MSRLLRAIAKAPAATGTLEVQHLLFFGWTGSAVDDDAYGRREESDERHDYENEGIVHSWRWLYPQSTISATKNRARQVAN